MPLRASVLTQARAGPALLERRLGRLFRRAHASDGRFTSPRRCQPGAAATGLPTSRPDNWRRPCVWWKTWRARIRRLRRWRATAPARWSTSSQCPRKAP